MRRIVILTGVLGGGTVLTFVAAGLAATMFPSGTLVYQQSHTFWAKPMPVEMIGLPEGMRGNGVEGGGVIVEFGPEVGAGD